MGLIAVGGQEERGDFEESTHLSQPMTLARAEETVVADLLKTFGQDVLQEATDELLGGEGAGFPAAGGAVTVAERDLTLLKFKDTPIGEGDAKNIGSQILEGRLTGANRLTVDDPGLPPDRGRDLVEQFGLLQGSAKLGPKQS
jgi:hypothetical protein